MEVVCVPPPKFAKSQKQNHTTRYRLKNTDTPKNTDIYRYRSPFSTLNPNKRQTTDTNFLLLFLSPTGLKRVEKCFSTNEKKKRWKLLLHISIYRFRTSRHITNIDIHITVVSENFASTQKCIRRITALSRAGARAVSPT